MKKSEELEIASQEEENDIKSFGLRCRALRERRSERFLEDWLPLIKLRFSVEERSNGSYSITTEDYGVLDYFPKANNLLIRSDNKWKKPGLKWMIRHLFKPE